MAKHLTTDNLADIFGAVKTYVDNKVENNTPADLAPLQTEVEGLAQKVEEADRCVACLNDILGDEPYEYDSYEYDGHGPGSEYCKAFQKLIADKLIEACERLGDDAEKVLLSLMYMAGFCVRVTGGADGYLNFVQLIAEPEEETQYEYKLEDTDLWIWQVNLEPSEKPIHYDSIDSFASMYASIVNTEYTAAVGEKAEKALKDVEELGETLNQKMNEVTAHAFEFGLLAARVPDMVPLSRKKVTFRGFESPGNPHFETALASGRTPYVYYLSNYDVIVSQFMASAYALTWPGCEDYGRKTTKYINGLGDCEVIEPDRQFLYERRGSAQGDYGLYIWSGTKMVEVSEAEAELLGDYTKLCKKAASCEAATEEEVAEAVKAIFEQ